MRDGEVIIVDEFTGRTLPGRRWSDGLHQAVEAKEGVPIQRESQTLASITFQNYFRMYKKLAGMTGTADTEAYEFQQIYGLEVVVIPTHRPMARKDSTDLVFLNQRVTNSRPSSPIFANAVPRASPSWSAPPRWKPVSWSPTCSRRKASKHEVLNAKQHEREAQIVAQAGKPGSVTIATNMAGRGTDIVLGGNPEVELSALGPDASEADKARLHAGMALRATRPSRTPVVLHIIGTERHESRRIDNQLRGRSGRQGDPGSSRFYLAFDDNLMRIFASDRMAALMQRLGMKPGEAIEHSMVNRAIENAQRKVEAHNFDIRKHLLDFDDVANDQRKVIYEQRNELIDAGDIDDVIANSASAMCSPVWRGVLRSIGLDRRTVGSGWIEQGACAMTYGHGVRRAASIVEGHPDSDAETIAAGVVRACADAAYAAREEQMTPANPAARPNAPSCCRCSISSGRSIWRAWTICGRGFICVVMRRSSPSRSSSGKPSSSSPRCWTGSRPKWSPS